MALLQKESPGFSRGVDVNPPPEVTNPKPDNFHVEDGKVTMTWTVLSTGERFSATVPLKEGIGVDDFRLVNLKMWSQGYPSAGIGPGMLLPQAYTNEPALEEGVTIVLGQRIGTLAGRAVVDAIQINGLRYEHDGIAGAAKAAEIQDGTVFVKDGIAYRAVQADTDRARQVRRALANGIRARISHP